MDSIFALIVESDGIDYKMRNENQIAVDEDALVDVAKIALVLTAKNHIGAKGNSFIGLVATFMPLCVMIKHGNNFTAWDMQAAGR